MVEGGIVELVTVQSREHMVERGIVELITEQGIYGRGRVS